MFQTTSYHTYVGITEARDRGGSGTPGDSQCMSYPGQGTAGARVRPDPGQKEVSAAPPGAVRVDPGPGPSEVSPDPGPNPGQEPRAP